MAYTACFSLQVCSNLEELGMSECGGGAKGATALAASLCHWPKLTRLEFSGNYAGNSGCKVFLLARTCLLAAMLRRIPAYALLCTPCE